MKNELLSLLSFAVGIAAYTVKELQMHGKLRWMKDDIISDFFSFWGQESHVRKYKTTYFEGAEVPIKAPSNWYYKFFKIKYRERFPGSSTFFVFVTDGMHLCQALFFVFISLSFVPLLNWTYGIAFWILAHVIHFTLYRTLQR